MVTFGFCQNWSTDLVAKFFFGKANSMGIKHENANSGKATIRTIRSLHKKKELIFLHFFNFSPENPFPRTPTYLIFFYFLYHFVHQNLHFVDYPDES
jgi:hypothetical protein